MKRKSTKRIVLVSSSGGHYEQLQMLKPLEQIGELVWITEKTKYEIGADHYLLQTGSKDFMFPIKMFLVSVNSLFLFIKYRPNYVITTGTMVAIPMTLLAKLFRRKLIYIETFDRVNDGTRTGKLIYRFADLFIIQWKELENVYPKAVYGGSIY